ncbi:MAG: hypothetical protein CVU39_22030 [Chloroflexi bacterium HGW-Chloroflexi-10]|nr:MAG: hypothetical protein CVU39_22030 [Chloroflexi bacterium HGW-Chloroflexi-10]
MHPMQNLTLIPFGLVGAVYRCPMPFGKFDLDASTLSELQQAGVKHVITLVEDFEWWKKANCDLPLQYIQAGLDMLHFPVPDFSIPQETNAYIQVVQQAIAWAQSGEALAVHCNAGIGRTGTFLAVMAMQIFYWPPNQAVKWVRDLIPTAVENELQYGFVMSLGN